MMLGAGEATLVSGTATVAHTKITAACIVILTRAALLGVVGQLTYTITDRTSFTITSNNVLDTSVVSWLVVA